MNSLYTQNSIETFPFKNIENVLDLENKTTLNEHYKCSDQSMIKKLKSQQKLINKLIKEHKKNTAQLSKLYNFIDSINLINSSTNNDTISVLLNSVKLMEKNKNFLDSLIASLNKNL